MKDYFLLLCLYLAPYGALGSTLISLNKVTTQPVLTSAQRQLDVLPLLGSLNVTFAFYAVVGLGTPPQRLPLLVSTDLGELIVLGSECTTCDPNAAKYTFSSTAEVISCSDTSVDCHDCQNIHGSRACTFDITFGDGSEFAGYLATDNFTVGNFSARVQFGSTVVENNVAQNQEGSVDLFSGFWGLGFAQESAWRGIPSMDALVAQAGIPNAFSMCLKEVNPTMVIGVDPRDTQDVEFTPLTSQSDFAITLNDIAVGGSSLGISSNVLSQPFCDISSDTAVIFLITPAYNAFVTALQNMCFTTDLIGVCGVTNDSLFDNFCWRMTDAQLDAFPNITFTVAGITTPLILTPRDYLVLITGFRCLGIAPSNFGTTLGIVFMQAFNVVFDRGGLHVGFAPLSSCVPLPPHVTTSSTGPLTTSGNVTTTQRATTGPPATTAPVATTAPRATTASGATTQGRATSGQPQNTSGRATTSGGQTGTLPTTRGTFGNTG